MRCPVVLAILGQQFWIILWWCSSLALLVSGFTFSYLWTQLYGGSYEQYVTASCWVRTVDFVMPFTWPTLKEKSLTASVSSWGNLSVSGITAYHETWIFTYPKREENGLQRSFLFLWDGTPGSVLALSSERNAAFPEGSVWMFQLTTVLPKYDQETWQFIDSQLGRGS